MTVKTMRPLSRITCRQNEVVMPLADKRLTRQDLETLGRNMAARRGIDYKLAGSAH
jgi:hypothetical protein